MDPNLKEAHGVLEETPTQAFISSGSFRSIRTTLLSLSFIMSKHSMAQYRRISTSFC